MSLGGVHGAVLDVDLSSGEITVEHPPDSFYLQHLGGRALVAHYLLRAGQPHANPLGPDNPLIFAPGVLTGTPMPGTGRHGIGAISPLTGRIASGEAGGWWGAEFKHAGFDALVIRGQAAEPVYLWIHDGEAEIRPATHLVGLLTADCQRAIRRELGDRRVRVAQIGPAGERLVPYAAIMHDVNRAAGRGGLGAVMGSKKLRAVAVRGTMPLALADRAPVRALGRWFNGMYPEQLKWVVETGTPFSVDGLSAVGGLPTRNFRDPLFDGASSINAGAMSRLLRGRDTCFACPMRCKQVVEHHDGPNIDPAYGGPEYETLAAFGSNCGVSDLVAIAKANELCAAYGLDTISAGATIAFAMECAERGILTAREMEGLNLSFGDAAAMLEAVQLIVDRQGIGELLCQGTAALSRHLGPETEPFALHVKGLEPGMHEPRLKPGMGVSFAICPVGADHMQSMHDTSYAQDGPAVRRLNAVAPIQPVPVTDVGDRKMRILGLDTNWRHVQDSALICMFYPYDLEQTATALTAVTGAAFTAESVLEVGERAATLCRLVNLRAGLSAAEDDLPQRFLEPFAEGPLAGRAMTRAELYSARHRYYAQMGWSCDRGVPLIECLRRLTIPESFWPGAGPGSA